MIKLARYIKPYMAMAIAAPVFMLIEVLMDLYQPALMSDIINIGVAGRDIKYVLTTGALMILIAIVGIAGGVGCTVYAIRTSMNFSRDIRIDVFKKVQAFSFANLDKYSGSTLITRLTNDVTQVQQIVAMLLRMMVRSPLMFVGGIVMAYSLNNKLASVFLVAIPLIVIIFLVILIKGFPLFMSVQKKLDKLNLVMRENLSGVRVVKAFVRGDYERQKFEAANSDLKQTTVSAFRIIVLLFPASMTVMNLAVIAVLWYGGLEYEAGEIQLGDIMAYINYMMQILMSLLMLGMGIMGISRGKVSADRINEVLDAEVDIIDPISPNNNVMGKGKVEFRNVTFRYPGSTGDPVLTKIDFSVNRGETVGILGETGAGKSSLISLLPRLYDVADGAVVIDGVDVRDMSLDFLRKKIGVVLQQAILFTGTISENIRWGNAEATDEEVIAAAKTAQAHDFIVKQEKGYDTDLGQMAVNLSGGQKQRLSIARALLKKPEILILDDSTSALDMTTEARLLKTLKSEAGDCTKFIIAQRISSVIDADKIIVLQGGEINGMGSHDELMESCEAYRDIYYSQRKEEVLMSYE